MRTHAAPILAAVLAITLSPCHPVTLSSASAGDWSNWRGPLHNGSSPEKNLPDKFDTRKPGQNNLAWVAPYGCRATPLIMGGRVYINGSVGEDETAQERVVCLDEKTGRKIWEHRFNIWHTAIVLARVTWT